MQERQGDITEDETVRFKSYLMSLGIDDPVTRDAYKSSNEYFKQLARQLAEILEEPVKVCKTNNIILLQLFEIAFYYI